MVTSPQLHCAVIFAIAQLSCTKKCQLIIPVKSNLCKQNWKTGGFLGVIFVTNINPQYQVKWQQQLNQAFKNSKCHITTHFVWNFWCCFIVFNFVISR